MRKTVRTMANNKIEDLLEYLKNDKDIGEDSLIYKYFCQKAENERFQQSLKEAHIDIAELKRLNAEPRMLLVNSVNELYPFCSLTDTGMFVSRETNGYEKWNAYVRNQAYREFAAEMHKEVQATRDKFEMGMLPYTATALDDVDSRIDKTLTKLVGENNDDR